MLTKAELQRLRSLREKKNRETLRLFVIEGEKVIRELLAAYKEHEDLISIGAYRSGANQAVDAAIAMRDEINKFLRQSVTDGSTVESARKELVALAQRCLAAKKPAAGPQVMKGKN